MNLGPEHERIAKQFAEITGRLEKSGALETARRASEKMNAIIAEAGGVDVLRA